MATYTYEQIYSDACKSIVRCDADASIAGRHDGADCVVVCDRKWGECTPSASIGYTNTSADLTTTKQIVSYDSGKVAARDSSGAKIPMSSTDVVTISEFHNGTEWVSASEGRYKYIVAYRYSSSMYLKDPNDNGCYISAFKYTIT